MNDLPAIFLTTLRSADSTVAPEAGLLGPERQTPAARSVNAPMSRDAALRLACGGGAQFPPHILRHPTALPQSQYNVPVDGSQSSRNTVFVFGGVAHLDKPQQAATQRLIDGAVGLAAKHSCQMFIDGYGRVYLGTLERDAKTNEPYAVKVKFQVMPPHNVADMATAGAVVLVPKNAKAFEPPASGLRGGYGTPSS